MSSNTKHAHLIANSKSGHGKAADVHEIAKRVCAELGWQLTNYEIETPDQIDGCAARAVSKAIDDGGIVIAAGGDGTIRSVAQHAAGTPVKFGIIPCGTFNFFARAHNIPVDHETAFRLALTTEPTPAQLGEINGEVFLINASLGLYAKVIRERREHMARFGRHRLVGTTSSLISLLRGHPNLHLSLKIDGEHRKLKTPMIFLGNNSLQLRDLAMPVARCMQGDQLAVILMKPTSKYEMFKILVSSIMKKLNDASSIESFCAEEVSIVSAKKHHTVALDGELFHMTSPLSVRSRPRVIRLVQGQP